MQLSNMVGLYNSTQGAAEVSSQIGVQKLVSTLSDMKAGNIFEGTVNSVKGGQVMLGLSNGQAIAARLDGSVSLSQGQSMFFQVKSNDGTTIAIRPFTVEGTQVNLTLMNALGAANLSINQQNLTMVNSMMENSMPIDRDSLVQMARLVSNQPTANVETLVQMTKLELPTSPEMISQFENYTNDKQAITTALDSFMEELPNAIANESLSGNELANTAGQVLTIITEDLDIAEQALPDSSLNQMDDQAGKQTAEAANLPEQANPTSTDANFPGQANPVTAGNTISGGEAAAQAETVVTEGENAGETAGQTADSQIIGTTGESQVGESAAEEAAVQSEAQAQSQMASASPNSLGAMFTGSQISNLTNNLYQANLLPDGLTLQPNQNAMELLQAVAAELPNLSDADKDSLMKLFTSVEFQDLTKEALQQQWTLKPQQLEGTTSEKISKLYEHLENQLDRLEEVVKASGQETEHAQNLTQTAAAIRNNVEFMNELNQTVSYVQIPLQMNGKNASGELYVYTNKKSLAQEDGELSAFLHLDLDHLGSTDVSVKMKDRNVDTKFYFEDDLSYQLVADHSDQLQARLEAKGYNCKISVVNEKEHRNPVDDLLTQSKTGRPQQGLVHRYSFDMRA